MKDKPVRRENVLERQVGDEWVLYDTVGRAVHVLNAPARFVWLRCDGEHALDDMVREAREQFEVEEATARQDIGECLETLYQTGAIS